MEKNHDPLPIGTAEAAVRSCVNVIAAVTAQREDQLAYWLDLYYRVRRAYEIEQNNEPDPKLCRVEDLYPVVRDMIRESLKTAAKEKAPRKEKETPAQLKQRILARLDVVRLAGVSVPEIAAASGGKLSEAAVMDFLERRPVAIESYKALSDALEKIRPGG